MKFWNNLLAFFLFQLYILFKFQFTVLYLYVSNWRVVYFQYQRFKMIRIWMWHSYSALSQVRVIELTQYCEELCRGKSSWNGEINRLRVGGRIGGGGGITNAPHSSLEQMAWMTRIFYNLVHKATSDTTNFVKNFINGWQGWISNFWKFVLMVRILLNYVFCTSAGYILTVGFVQIFD